MNPMDDARFDAAMRARYLAAAQATPPRLQAQVRPQPGAVALPWWKHWQLPAGLAATAAVALLAIAVQRTPPTDVVDAGTPRIAITTPNDASADPLADPDFYAWLGSSDAARLAME